MISRLVGYVAHVATIVTPFAPGASDSPIALGLLAVRDVSLLTGTTAALAAQYAMLRGFFQPWSDELVSDLQSNSGITQACLPAVPHDLLAALPPAALEAAPVTRLHAAMLTGSAHGSAAASHTAA